MNDYFAESHSVFTHEDYYQALVADLKAAGFLFILQSPYLAPRRVEKLKETLYDCSRRGVQCCVFVRRDPESDATRDVEKEAFTARAAEILRQTGVHVNFRPYIHEKLVIIDDVIAYDGSLNTLSQRRTSERMTRWKSRLKVREIMDTHKLATCESCMHNNGNLCDDFRKQPDVGAQIRIARLRMGLSQREVARITKIDQAVISKVETGNCAVKLSTLLRLLDELHLGFRIAQQYQLPSIDGFISKHKETQRRSGHLMLCDSSVPGRTSSRSGCAPMETG
ncbi:MAG TPA: helix-turn-helix domain-containing protein [Candidatus Obscuribacterales bacterium]